MRHRLWIATTIAAIAALLLGIVSFGQGTGIAIWHTVDGGGGVSQGSTFTVRGTAGQPDAGAMAGETYTLSGGFWGGPGLVEHEVYLPLVLRAFP
jgi:hypothetical protein